MACQKYFQLICRGWGGGGVGSASSEGVLVPIRLYIHIKGRYSIKSYSRRKHLLATLRVVLVCRKEINMLFLKT